MNTRVFSTCTLTLRYLVCSLHSKSCARCQIKPHLRWKSTNQVEMLSWWRLDLSGHRPQKIVWDLLSEKLTLQAMPNANLSQKLNLRSHFRSTLSARPNHLSRGQTTSSMTSSTFTETAPTVGRSYTSVDQKLFPRPPLRPSSVSSDGIRNQSTASEVLPNSLMRVFN